MALSIRFAAEADASAVARVKASAFKHNQIERAMYPVHNGQVMEAWLYEEAIRDMQDPGVQILVLADNSTGEIVAGVRLMIPIERGQGPPPPTKTESPYPAGSKIDLCRAFSASLHAARTKHRDEATDYALKSLSTLKSHQNRGCASMLIQWLVRRADSEGARIYLEATEATCGLYAKYGWEKVDEFITDLSKFGAEGIERTIVMMRKPVTASTA